MGEAGRKLKDDLVAASRRLASDLVGSSTAMEGVRRLIAQVAPAEASVLILGESGTGKEVVARGIHRLSARSRGPFVPVNCGAIPGELLESELFGHEKGAFTGAISARQGRFELAAGGTLFLDEIGDMPLPMQVKLLRVLQERSFERVGSNRTLDCDVRVIAATHQDLERRVDAGEFRMDLFFRLNVFPIEMPPLRGHAEDVPALVRRFAAMLEREERGSVRLADDAMASLMRYAWPGNVRELSNLVERLAILHPDEEVRFGDLPERFRLTEAAGEAVPSPGRLANYRSDGGGAGEPERSPGRSIAAPMHRDETSAAANAYRSPAPAVSAPPSRADRDALLEPWDEASVTPERSVDEDRSAEQSVAMPAQAPEDHYEERDDERPSPANSTTTFLSSEGLDLKSHLADLERSLMVQALDRTDWVVARAAKLLNLQRTTLVEKMRKYEIVRPEESTEA
ncbi:MAG: sigma 54-interacting transcriptional regulator [Halieaceae bacterium]|jgi:sigma-54 specific flagellar transcriptional regulator A|nr:sigma 54-interacting transcriptional regulator [Halieaceae bacterium]